MINNIKNILFFLLIIISTFYCSQKKESQAIAEASVKEDTIVDLPKDTIQILDSEGNFLKRIVFTDETDEYGAPLYLNSIKGFPESMEIKGHFTSPSNEITAIIEFEKPKPDQSLSELKTQLLFSDKNIPLIDLGIASGATFKNEGDLNQDGLDEIGYMVGYPSGSCRTYKVISYLNNKWTTLFELETSLNMRQAGILPLEKGKNFIKLRMSIEGYLKMYPQKKSSQLIKTTYSCQNSDVVEIIISRGND